MQGTGNVMKKKNPYVMMDITSLRDTRLSWKAKGLMTYFLDKPPYWKFMIKAIFNASTDGERSVRAGLKELQKYGYLVRVAFRKNKKLSHYEFFIYEEPVAYPSEKVIYLDYDLWITNLKEGNIVDITLFARNVHEQNVHEENGEPLVIINSTKELKEKDIYIEPPKNMYGLD